MYTTKTPITAADLLNDRVLPCFESQGMGIIRILTDRGTEYCGKAENHDYQLYLAVNDIEHTKTKAAHPQTNGICERFHKTVLQEFYQVTFRKKIYRSIEELQQDLDDWLRYYNNERTHQGKMCCGRTPLQTLIDGKEVWRHKIDNLDNQSESDKQTPLKLGKCPMMSRLVHIMESSRKWTLPIQNWKSALNRFCIEFGDRVSSFL